LKELLHIRAIRHGAEINREQQQVNAIKSQVNEQTENRGKISRKSRCITLINVKASCRREPRCDASEGPAAGWVGTSLAPAGLASFATSLRKDGTLRGHSRSATAEPRPMSKALPHESMMMELSPKTEPVA
jgi:hypothetical protein